MALVNAHYRRFKGKRTACPRPAATYFHDESAVAEHLAILQVMGALFVKFGEFGPCQRQVIHQTFISHDETDNGIFNVRGVNRSPGPNFD